MKPGDHVKIIKPTFLFKGVFIIQNSVVEVLEVAGNEVKVLYRDREGLEHQIPFQLSELTSV